MRVILISLQWRPTRYVPWTRTLDVGHSSSFASKDITQHRPYLTWKYKLHFRAERAPRLPSLLLPLPCARISTFWRLLPGSNAVIAARTVMVS